MGRTASAGDEGCDFSVNYLYGGVGNDTMYGGNGDDCLFGENGTDSPNRLAGNDVLYGGNQADHRWPEEAGFPNSFGYNTCTGGFASL
jgi:Ca2+-binding RTX toxin-like protein